MKVLSLFKYKPKPYNQYQDWERLANDYSLKQRKIIIAITSTLALVLFILMILTLVYW